MRQRGHDEDKQIHLISPADDERRQTLMKCVIIILRSVVLVFLTNCDLFLVLRICNLCMSYSHASALLSGLSTC